MLCQKSKMRRMLSDSVLQREEVNEMAGGMWNPKNRKIITIVALILIVAMIVPSVLSLILGWF